MNQDEIGSLVRKLLIALLSGAASRFQIDAQTGLALATSIADVVVIGWGVWIHWNMKKVPENAIVADNVNRRIK